MQAAVWTVSNQCYAIDTRHIMEVIPMVELRPIAHAMAWVCGMMNYRGRLVPVLDARALLGLEPCQPRMFSRIVMVSVAYGAAGEAGPLGLLVERFLGVERLEPGEASTHPGLEIPDAGYLGPVAVHDRRLVQMVEPDKLLKAEHQAVLFDRARSPVS